MADLWMDVDAALAEVPVNIMPLLDDTDFKTREETVAYNAAGLELIWHFVTTAGATSATVVTPTTAGVYDWAHQDGGIYTIEIPASGGVSINNDTEGFGWFTGVATGVLPWRGPVIGFRAAALNDALVDGGDNLDVNVTQWLGTAAATPTTAGVPEVDVTFWKGSAAPAMTGDAFARIGAAGAGLTALGDTRIANLNATVSSRLATSGYTAPDSAATIAAAVWAYVVEGSFTAVQFLRGIAAAAMGKASGLDTTSATFRDVSDTKDRLVATVDEFGNRSAIVRDLS